MHVQRVEIQMNMSDRRDRKREREKACARASNNGLPLSFSFFIHTWHTGRHRQETHKYMHTYVCSPSYLFYSKIDGLTFVSFFLYALWGRSCFTWCVDWLEWYAKRNSPALYMLTIFILHFTKFGFWFGLISRILRFHLLGAVSTQPL